MRRRFGEASLRVVVTPERAPNANAYAERFVRSMKEECLDRMIPIGERHSRRSIAEYVAHYHQERNHQGLAGERHDASGAAPVAVGWTAHLFPAGRLMGSAEVLEQHGAALQCCPSPYEAFEHQYG